MKKTWLAALVLGLAPVACHTEQAAANPLQINLNQVFTLKGGQEATINGQDLRLRFDKVLEDSRCPKKVECFWTGQARIALLVEPTGRGETTLEFNTNPAPNANNQTARLDEYTITMKSLEPYPQTPDESLALEDYRATLTVGKEPG
ncbi:MULTISPECIES: hypothetical protein [unclassified Mycobacterium]|uniref:hypothetical protein n=1 Tax=unclassified Mycobacterium TaxID=2642494 RepID=UPI0029C88514|nr:MULTISPECIES: hypothetical protein [unclassified Mycobacterium]